MIEDDLEKQRQSLRERRIVHLDLDCFFVSVERLLNAELAGKAVIVGGSSGRGVVTSCSYEARRYGVHASMPAITARKLCPDAIFVKSNFERYVFYSNLVTKIISNEVPVFQKASIDEFFLDLTGTDRYYNSTAIAKALRAKIIKETGLPISMGMATSKTVAKMATNHAKPNGQLQVESGFEADFLAPLSIDKIPMVGKKTTALLKSLGIGTIGQLQLMSPLQLHAILGKHGILLWKRANGIDLTEVSAPSARKSMSKETTFASDVKDVQSMLSILSAMAEELSSQLRFREHLASCISIKIRYTNFETCEKQQAISATNFDHLVIPKMKELFSSLYDPRRSVRLVGVALSGLVSGGTQITLFDDARKHDLYHVVDRLNHRFGEQTVRRGATLK